MVRGADADARSDLFAVGTLIYELGTSRPPFGTEATVLQTLFRTMECDYSTPPDFPDDLLDLLSNTLTPNPEARYQSARDMQDALREVAVNHDYNPDVLTQLLQQTEAIR